MATGLGPPSLGIAIVEQAYRDAKRPPPILPPGPGVTSIPSESPPRVPDSASTPLRLAGRVRLRRLGRNGVTSADPAAEGGDVGGCVSVAR